MGRKESRKKDRPNGCTRGIDGGFKPSWNLMRLGLVAAVSMADWTMGKIHLRARMDSELRELFGRVSPSSTCMQ